MIRSLRRVPVLAGGAVRIGVILSVLLTGLAPGLLLAAPAAPAPAPAPPPAAKPERTRSLVLAELKAAEAAWCAAPSDPAARLAVLRLMFESGDFWRARYVALPLAEAATASDEAIEAGRQLTFLTGDFEGAEKLYDRLLALRSGDPGKQVLAKVGKMFVYLQQNRFDAIKALGFPAGAVLPNATLAASFERNPYRLEWAGKARSTEVPFLATDPLPTFPIEVEGRKLNVLFDTGGDLLILDDQVAKELGVVSVTSATGTFGGGLPANVGFGRVGKVRIGGVTVHDVPVMVLAAKRFTFDPEHPVGGIFGTALARQFLTTLDYKRGRLVLRERSPENGRALRKSIAARLAGEVPFVLDATHLLLASGRLNGKEGLTFFVDSGLASEAAFAAPIQTLQDVGIPVPETKMPEGGVGGGGGKFPEGFFPIRFLDPWPLLQRDVQGEIKGEYGALPPESYHARGYIQDGLISHGFLRRYASWTLDFDSRTFLFER